MTVTDSLPAHYTEKIYAGVLGKIIGVYLGRPVEGWRYVDLHRRFGELNYYVNAELGEPLVVADDDVSGTFAFVRALEDHCYPATLEPGHVGDTWLNYIIENRTILWWGGLGRSTEHTAFLRLLDGVTAPRSGSFHVNGRTLPEQVGAQIFSDAFAMAYPGDPERAAAAVRAAASVSHDGVALDAAAFLAAMRANAFDEADLGRLIEGSRHHVTDPRLATAIDQVTSLCSQVSDWREVRDRIDRDLGYANYNGPCHVIPNHAMTLAALLLGADNFQRSVMIAASAGFDTDSNAGVVGCLNGIRLGLDAITAQADLRAEVADRMLVVTADGGSCVTDAVRETARIARAATANRGGVPAPAPPRYNFAWRGSVQGFTCCPHMATPYPTVSITNSNTRGQRSALVLHCHGVGPGVPAAISTPVFPDPAEQVSNFSTIASPTLYPGQQIRVTVHAEVTDRDLSELRMFVLYRDNTGAIIRTASDPFPLRPEEAEITWRAPDCGTAPFVRFGLLVESAQRFDGDVHVSAIDWYGAPDRFTVEGILLTSIWDTFPAALGAWVSSAANFEADFDRTFSVSHPRGTGLATIGTTDWDDYCVASTLRFSLHRRAGLVARSVGHKRYYAALFQDDNTICLIRQRDAECRVLAEAEISYGQDTPYACELRCVGSTLSLLIDGRPVCAARDEDQHYQGGAAGFLIDTGTLLADGFVVQAIGSGAAR
jgi:ADP-ribosylglycohydrolase